MRGCGTLFLAVCFFVVSSFALGFMVERLVPVDRPEGASGLRCLVVAVSLALTFGVVRWVNPRNRA